MLTLTSGNLLDADVEALVNTVNTVGVMGKGIALQFKQAFPENFKAYRAACEHDEVQPGRIFVHDLGRLRPRYIFNFPTKRHWRSRSQFADIEAGLQDLRRVVRELHIRSVAVPPLGCGSGGLDWADVFPLIEQALGDLEDVEVLVFPPAGPPDERSMPVATPRPRMTLGRAALLALAGHYDELGLGVSQIEMQKLMYFLQEAGEPLRLRYEAGYYGPYADNLNHVLATIEGHFIRGFGDRTKAPHEAAPLQLDPEAVDEANWSLRGEKETQTRIEAVLRLVEGFESPYGLELLATLHWLASHDDIQGFDVEELADHLKSWSERKGRIFGPLHIRAAWDRLRATGWVKEPATV